MEKSMKFVDSEKKAKPIIEYNQTARHGGYDGRKDECYVLFSSV